MLSAVGAESERQGFTMQDSTPKKQFPQDNNYRPTETPVCAACEHFIVTKWEYSIANISLYGNGGKCQLFPDVIYMDNDRSEWYHTCDLWLEIGTTPSNPDSESE